MYYRYMCASCMPSQDGATFLHQVVCRDCIVTRVMLTADQSVYGVVSLGIQCFLVVHFVCYVVSMHSHVCWYVNCQLTWTQWCWGWNEWGLTVEVSVLLSDVCIVTMILLTLRIKTQWLALSSVETQSPAATLNLALLLPSIHLGNCIINLITCCVGAVIAEKFGQYNVTFNSRSLIIIMIYLLLEIMLQQRQLCN